jgi:Rad3-related DNA helicase
MRFDERNVLIVDEAHEMEGILREFATLDFTVSKLIPENLLPDMKKQDISYWVEYFSNPELMPKTAVKKEAYDACLETLRKRISEFNTSYVAKVVVDDRLKKTTFLFIPLSVGKEANNLIFSCASKALLMSGTIYNKDIYCKSIGIAPEEAYFIRIPSSFPEDSRPIICKPQYLIDTSHAKWKDNKEGIGEILESILEKFEDVKGLIHAPSYSACTEIKAMLNNPRIKTHTTENFIHELDKFYKASGNGVFLSPTCYQGVDFKQDRARFQIIIRVPYSNTSDEFMAYNVENNYPWYNHQALVTFGQQIGRINRSEDDFGVTILMDERFLKFLRRNYGVLPMWLRNSIKY